MKLCWHVLKAFACLEAASPESSEAIACLIAEEASTDKIKKVKKTLRSIGKKGSLILLVFVVWFSPDLFH